MDQKYRFKPNAHLCIEPFLRCEITALKITKPHVNLTQYRMLYVWPFFLMDHYIIISGCKIKI